MKKANISPMGTDLHGIVGRFGTEQGRAALWNKLLKDDHEGNIVNASSALHYEDHKRMLDDVVAARKYMPTAYSALIGVPGIGVSASISDTLIGYQNMNEFNAEISMNGANRQSNESNYEFNWVPLPIYHCDFHIQWRQGGFGYKQGDGASESTMQVELLRDKTLIEGNSGIVVNVNGVESQLYGLTNHPATITTATGVNWTTATDGVAADAIKLIGELYTDATAAQIPNSVIVFVANDVWTNLQNDYASAKGDRTIIERIEAIPAVRNVLPNQYLASGSVLMVEANPMTLRIANAGETTVMPWQRSNEMEDLRFTTFAASALQVRADRNDKTGILYAS